MNELMKAVIFGVYLFGVLLVLDSILFSKQNTLKKRLDRIQAMGNPGEGLLREEPVQKKQFRRPAWFDVSGRLKKELDGAGIALNPVEFIAIWLASAAIPPAGGYIVTGSALIAAACLAVGAAIPTLVVKATRKKRLNQFSVQLGDTLMTVGNCLRSGFSIGQSIERVATDMPDPIGMEFRMAVMEMNYGESLENALTAVAVRMENKDLELVTTAIRIQQRAGGNLSEIIDNVSETIKDRIRIRKNLRTLTAQGRVSGMVLGGLPIVSLAAITIMNPEYTSAFYTTSFGVKALLLAAAMEAAGFLVINKIVNIQI